MGVANKPHALVAVLALALALSGAAAGGSSATVEIYNDFGKHVSLDCLNGGIGELDQGQSYSFEVDNGKIKDGNAYLCEVDDGPANYIQARGFDGARDKDHLKVYWKISTDGFVSKSSNQQQNTLIIFIRKKMGLAKKPNSLMVVMMLALMALALSGANARASSSRLSSGLAAPVIEFDNDYGNQVTLECGLSSRIKDVKLAPGQSYSIKVNVKSKHMDDYDCMLSDDSNSVYVEGQAYDAVRDKGRMNIYWKVDTVGLYRSYDKLHWVLEEKWSSID
ncbi:unnamed protein product [Cuscuta campestris]|uniref:S-protein homolog n=1 Tax=Cuscuta campestris TaxID=132261 RepID=A0A484KBB7_9ASTE|nr:unnamed protein product [Cuscuta campestris]